MTVIASAISLLTKMILIVVTSDAVNAACQPASREYQMHQGTVFTFYPSLIQDHVLKDTIYQMISASSYVVCAVHCLQNDSCKSFNYCNDKKLCQLKTANFSVNGSEIQLSAGCSHYGEEIQTKGKHFIMLRNILTCPVSVEVVLPSVFDRSILCCSTTYLPIFPKKKDIINDP